MNNDTKEILNEVYELEGLLHLMSRADAGTSPERLEEIRQLAEDKASGILSRLSFDNETGSSEMTETLETLETTETFENTENFGSSGLSGNLESIGNLESHEVLPERGAPQFALNDKFRFRRELFGGSDADFNASMQLLTQFDDISQAEDYFYNDLQWDAEDPTVAEFMEIIRKYYSK